MVVASCPPRPCHGGHTATAAVNPTGLPPGSLLFTSPPLRLDTLLAGASGVGRPSSPPRCPPTPRPEKVVRLPPKSTAEAGSVAAPPSHPHHPSPIGLPL